MGLGLLGILHLLGCGLWGLGWEGWSDTVIKNIVITALLLAGGVLHVVVWWKERQSKRAASEHQSAEPTVPFYSLKLSFPLSLQPQMVTGHAPSVSKLEVDSPPCQSAIIHSLQ